MLVKTHQASRGMEKDSRRTWGWQAGQADRGGSSGRPLEATSGRRSMRTVCQAGTSELMLPMGWNE